MTSLKLEIQNTRWMWYWFVVEPKRLNAIVWLCECVRDFNVRIHFYLFRKWTSVTTLCTVCVSLVVVCRRYLLLTCSHTYIFSVEKRVNVTFVYQHRHSLCLRSSRTDLSYSLCLHIQTAVAIKFSVMFTFCTCFRPVVTDISSFMFTSLLCSTLNPTTCHHFANRCVLLDLAIAYSNNVLHSVFWFTQ